MSFLFNGQPLSQGPGGLWGGAAKPMQEAPMMKLLQEQRKLLAENMDLRRQLELRSFPSSGLGTSLHGPGKDTNAERCRVLENENQELRAELRRLSDSMERDSAAAAKAVEAASGLQELTEELRRQLLEVEQLKEHLRRQLQDHGSSVQARPSAESDDLSSVDFRPEPKEALRAPAEEEAAADASSEAAAQHGDVLPAGVLQGLASAAAALASSAGGAEAAPSPQERRGRHWHSAPAQQGASSQGGGPEGGISLAQSSQPPAAGSQADAKAGASGPDDAVNDWPRKVDVVRTFSSPCTFEANGREEELPRRLQEGRGVSKAESLLQRSRSQLKRLRQQQREEEEDRCEASKGRTSSTSRPRRASAELRRQLGELSQLQVQVANPALGSATAPAGGPQQAPPHDPPGVQQPLPQKEEQQLHPQELWQTEDMQQATEHIPQIQQQQQQQGYPGQQEPWCQTQLVQSRQAFQQPPQRQGQQAMQLQQPLPEQQQQEEEEVWQAQAQQQAPSQPPLLDVQAQQPLEQCEQPQASPLLSRQQLPESQASSPQPQSPRASSMLAAATVAVGEAARDAVGSADSPWEKQLQQLQKQLTNKPKPPALPAAKIQRDEEVQTLLHERAALPAMASKPPRHSAPQPSKPSVGDADVAAVSVAAAQAAEQAGDTIQERRSLPTAAAAEDVTQRHGLSRHEQRKLSHLDELLKFEQEQRQRNEEEKAKTGPPAAVASRKDETKVSRKKAAQTAATHDDEATDSAEERRNEGRRQIARRKAVAQERPESAGVAAEPGVAEDPVADVPEKSSDGRDRGEESPMAASTLEADDDAAICGIKSQSDPVDGFNSTSASESGATKVSSTTAWTAAADISKGHQRGSQPQAPEQASTPDMQQRGRQRAGTSANDLIKTPTPSASRQGAYPRSASLDSGGSRVGNSSDVAGELVGVAAQQHRDARRSEHHSATSAAAAKMRLARTPIQRGMRSPSTSPFSHTSNGHAPGFAGPVRRNLDKDRLRGATSPPRESPVVCGRPALRGSGPPDQEQQLATAKGSPTASSKQSAERLHHLVGSAPLARQREERTPPHPAVPPHGAQEQNVGQSASQQLARQLELPPGRRRAAAVDRRQSPEVAKASFLAARGGVPQATAAAQVAQAGTAHSPAQPRAREIPQADERFREQPAADTTTSAAGKVVPAAVNQEHDAPAVFESFDNAAAAGPYRGALGSDCAPRRASQTPSTRSPASKSSSSSGMLFQRQTAESTRFDKANRNSASSRELDALRAERSRRAPVPSLSVPSLHSPWAAASSSGTADTSFSSIGPASAGCSAVKSEAATATSLPASPGPAAPGVALAQGGSRGALSKSPRPAGRCAAAAGHGNCDELADCRTISRQSSPSVIGGSRAVTPPSRPSRSRRNSGDSQQSATPPSQQEDWRGPWYADVAASLGRPKLQWECSEPVSNGTASRLTLRQDDHRRAPQVAAPTSWVSRGQRQVQHVAPVHVQRPFTTLAAAVPGVSASPMVVPAGAVAVAKPMSPVSPTLSQQRQAEKSGTQSVPLAPPAAVFAGLPPASSVDRLLPAMERSRRAIQQRMRA
eukprot:TRINITY_DN2607_c1_g1_i3.p1 TRINITY_DN2607_c1_g1~~TRINITY_DN2607_c1_g1_i3.p1  ORF type:complete len:1575 (+),score=459.32 TRINITY_DN2607_c1_g1_i3:96-4820(+)